MFFYSGHNYFCLEIELSFNELRLNFFSLFLCSSHWMTWSQGSLTCINSQWRLQSYLNIISLYLFCYSLVCILLPQVLICKCNEKALFTLFSRSLMKCWELAEHQSLGMTLDSFLIMWLPVNSCPILAGVILSKSIWVNF